MPCCQWQVVTHLSSQITLCEAKAPLSQWHWTYAKLRHTRSFLFSFFFIKEIPWSRDSQCLLPNSVFDLFSDFNSPISNWNRNQSFLTREKITIFPYLSSPLLVWLCLTGYCPPLFLTRCLTVSFSVCLAVSVCISVHSLMFLMCVLAQL